MVKKVFSYALIPVLLLLFILGLHMASFQVQAFTLPNQHTAIITPPIPTVIPTIPPFAVDISNDFTDINFKKAVWQWLGKSGDPGAFSLADIQDKLGEGAQMLNISSKSISSLNGLEHFEGIKRLNCGNNNLTSLPSLPSTLIELICGTNELTGLPALPNSIFYLDCQNNKLTSLPVMPESLKYFDCSKNNLTALPELPVNIDYLYCRYNKLTELTMLPYGLEEIHCAGNQITAIDIPDTVKVLFCDENMLRSLPQLPEGFMRLSCKDNQLTRLPSLPNNINYINVVNNILTELPNLPDTVLQFKGEYNYLDVLSTSLMNPLNKPNYTYRPQYRIKYAGDDILEVEMGDTVFWSGIKKQMSSDGNIWGDVSGVTTDSLTLSSDDNSVARIDSAGNVTGVNIGTTNINVFYKGIESKYTKAIISVNVIPASVPEPTTQPPEEPESEVQYGETSSYAIPYLDQAVDLGIITDRLRGQSMVVATTRQEFAELAVKFYEKVTGITAPIPVGKTFTDCDNPEVLKAFGLKITYGTGDGTQFEPNTKLSRQQMAAMIERTLKACYPNIVIDTLGQADFKDQKDFASYSIVPAKFMAKYTITVGDGQGHFDPNGDCLRQQTIIFLVKAYNFRDQYIYE